MTENVEVVRQRKDGITRVVGILVILGIVLWPLMVILASFFRGRGFAILACMGLIIWFSAIRSLYRGRPLVSRAVGYVLILTWLAWCFGSLMDFPQWYAWRQYHRSDAVSKDRRSPGKQGGD